MNYYLGVDLGTTGLKAGVVTDTGEQVAVASREYRIDAPRPGWAQQDPGDWWKALVACCRDIEETETGLLGKVDAVSLCGQMHTQVLLDDQDVVLRPAITWMDQRASQIVDRVNADEAARSMIVGESQNQLTSTYTAAHLAWIQANESEVWKRTRTVLVAKDYLKYLMTGAKRIDYSEASGTLLFNNVTEAWSEELLRYFSVSPDLLPQPGESIEVIGTITPATATALGLKQGTPVINGSTDNSAAALGGGMVSAGEAALIIGTAGVVSVCSDQARPDPEFRTLSWHYCLPNRWINLGVTQTAGESLNWFKRAFDGSRVDASSGDIFAEYNRDIAEVPDGCEGLVFLPYLNGERTPHWDANARGVFFGIGIQHEKAHFIKAIMEGVSFALRQNVESVEDLGTEVTAVRAVGGGLKSPVWRSSLAKILARPIETVERPDTGNVGNAILAAVATGRYESPEAAVATMVTSGNRLSEDSSEILEKSYAIYTSLYTHNRDLFASLHQD